MPIIRELGDFKNDRAVEYATIEVRIPNKLLPVNLREYEYDDIYHPDDIVTLSISPSGRLTKTHKPIYLNSTELADSFCLHIHSLFEKRKYAKYYELEVKVLTSFKSKTVTKGKEKHSSAIDELLSSL